MLRRHWVTETYKSQTDLDKIVNQYDVPRFRTEFTTIEDFQLRRNIRYFDIENDPKKDLLPIDGYQQMPIVSLGEAVVPLEPIILDIRRQAQIAKQNSHSSKYNLTQDESALIYLYTLEWEPHSECLYVRVNQTLRSDDREQSKPWFLYLKLVLTALNKLKSVQRTVWRGIKVDLRKEYQFTKCYT
ncbi:unnamed protein product [Didymodactylos carnosus]|uniref:Uncharacterized protein n=1 Tax=Didymodactylos carnosus TaxID=1234261 RepID=A0A8S2DJZ2_9BILA|nr:unnamed protein product [Didymodactylos carnosus]CAF3701897.1 unnamed protein product [Didymodactylos carnosus]